MLGLIFITAVNAVVPIVLLIVAGYLLRRTGLLTQEFAKVGNALVFKVCLPCMLFVNVYEIGDLGAVPWQAMIYCAVMICVIVGLGLAAAVASTRDTSRRGVIWQASFRSNYAIIGITLSAALGGQAASAFSSLLAAFAIPLFNTFAVIALTVFANRESKGGSAKKLVLDIIKNPLNIGVAAGLVCLGIRALQERLFGQVVFALDTDAKCLYSVFGSIKSMTTPLALLVLGAQFEFSAVKGMAREITVGTLMRIVVAPLVGVGSAVLLSRYTQLLCVGPAELPGMLALFGSPVAVSSAIMAEQMGNDGQLASQLVVWTSIGSIVTIFVFSCVLMSMGLISV